MRSTAFYSLTHVPRADLPALLAAIHRWLRPGGVLIATMGAQDLPTRSRTTGWAPRCSSATTAPRGTGRSSGAAGFEIERRDRRDGARGPPRRARSCGSWPASRPAARHDRCLTRGSSRTTRARRRPPCRRDPQAIVEHARAEYPNEACGLIVGDGRRRTAAGPALRGDAQRGRLAVPLRDRPDRPVPDHVAADDADEVIWGIVHSHTHTPAVPSPTDIGLAFYPDALYILVSLGDDEADPATR